MTDSRGRCPECGRSFDRPISQCPSCAVGLCFQPKPPMTEDQWVRERARELTGQIIGWNTEYSEDKCNAIIAFGQEAISRTRSEERAAAQREARTLRNIAVNADDRANAAEAKLARIRDPDEAMVETVAAYLRIGYVDEAHGVIRAIAAHLDEKDDNGNEK